MTATPMIMGMYVSPELAAKARSTLAGHCTPDVRLSASGLLAMFNQQRGPLLGGKVTSSPRPSLNPYSHDDGGDDDDETPVSTPTRYASLNDWAAAPEQRFRAIALGYASVFWQSYPHYGKSEHVRPGAFKYALKPGNLINGGNIKALIGHDTAKLLGSIDSGSLYVEEDDIGLLCALSLPLTLPPPMTRDDYGLLDALRRQDVIGMSMCRFDGATDGNPNYHPDGRRLDDVRVWEVSFITDGTGANPAALAILGREEYGRRIWLTESDNYKPSVLPRGLSYRSGEQRKALQRLGELGAKLPGH